jgi:hypothetical protein
VHPISCGQFTIDTQNRLPYTPTVKKQCLINKRPYKEAFSLEKSYAIIKEGRGTHFDPDVVDVFFASENELLAIKEKYKDQYKSLFLQMVDQ